VVVALVLSLTALFIAALFVVTPLQRRRPSTQSIANTRVRLHEAHTQFQAAQVKAEIRANADGTRRELNRELDLLNIRETKGRGPSGTASA
jgi:hypothetical protein